jgi:hypothetical protein
VLALIVLPLLLHGLLPAYRQTKTGVVVPFLGRNTNTEAAQCVSCHMIKRFYMVIDGRRDHSFRVPRPDLSGRIGTPNVCTDCHAGRTAQWAADAVAQWYGPDRKGGDVYHALGLSWVRQQRLRDAIPELAKAAQLRPDVPRYAYVYGVALHEAGQVQRAGHVSWWRCRQAICERAVCWRVWSGTPRCH